MRFIVSALVIAVSGPAGAALLAHGVAGVGHALATLSASLPDSATLAVMSGGFGLVAGARRGRRQAVTD